MDSAHLLIELSAVVLGVKAGTSAKTRQPVSMALSASVFIVLPGLFVSADAYIGDMFARVVENLIDRTEGPMWFRIYMQPAMASLLGMIGAINDAREGRPPYFLSLFMHDGGRRKRFKEGWKAISRVFLFAIVLDVGYQLYVEQWVYPLETLIVAFVLAIVPYLIVRGLVKPAATKFLHSAAPRRSPR